MSAPDALIAKLGDLVRQQCDEVSQLATLTVTRDRQRGTIVGNYIAQGFSVAAAQRAAAVETADMDEQVTFAQATVQTLDLQRDHMKLLIDRAREMERAEKGVS